MKFTDEEKDCADDALHAILAIRWTKTRQGGFFWSLVCDCLGEIAGAETPAASAAPVTLN